nr:T9SS type A sorting domain-containing protein [Bacteroidales bacterium]
VNTTDAAQANYWGPNPYSIQKVRFHAGDVAGPDLFVGSTDAIRIQANFVNGTAFDKAAWTFWRSGFSILHNPLEEEPEYTEYYTKVSLPVGSDASANMYGLVTGDFNRSFNPNITKAASASLDLVYSGIIRAGHEQEIELPLRIAKAATLGAISLVMEIPSDLVEIKNVATEGTGGQLSWAVTGNELRIGWHSPVPLVLGPDGIVATLKLRTTSAFTPGNSIRIRLASDPRNELADEMYEVIGNALLAIDAIEAAPTGVDDPQMNGFFTCYPNPSTDGIIFSYSIPENGHVTLEIFSIIGKKEVTVIEQVQPAGNYRINTGHLNLANGIYTARLTFKDAGHEFSQTLKIIRN